MDITRDFRQFSERLRGLTQDVYAQPPDDGHLAWGMEALNTLGRKVEVSPGARVLDVGCGQGQFAPALRQMGYEWAGVVIGEDFLVCLGAGLPAYEADMSFPPFPDNHFNLVFARHVLEHSPFPILTLMEWRRVCSGHLLLVSPSPEYWGYKGVNHYSVAPAPQLRWWLERAGWKVIGETSMTTHCEAFLRAWRAAFGVTSHRPEDGQLPDLATVEHRFLCEASDEVRG